LPVNLSVRLSISVYRNTNPHATIIKMKTTVRVLSIIALLALSACASTYQQAGVASLSAKEISTIEVVPCDGANCTIIQEVDNKFRGVGWFKKFELTPGKHSLKILYKAPGLTSQGAVIIEFEAKPGETYGLRPNTDASSMQWMPEVFEKATNKGVSKFVRTAAAY
jgi:hypothetical protein